MKKKRIRRGSAISTAMALFTALMLTAGMTLACTFTVFADDTDPDSWQTNDRIRDVSKKQEITFRGEDPNNGPPPPPIPGHGQNNNPDPEDDNIAPTDEKSPDLSEFGSEGGNMYDMYPDDNPDSTNNNNDNDHEIDNNSGEGTGPGQEEDQLSSEPLPGEEGKKPSDPEKKKADVPDDGDTADNEKNKPEKEGDHDKRAEKNSGTSDDAAVRVSDKTSDDPGSDKDKSSADETKDSGSAVAGSPQTDDSSALADAVTLFLLSTACLAAMMHGRRNRETDTQGR